MIKKTSITIIVLSIIEIICYYIPFCFRRGYWTYEEPTSLYNFLYGENVFHGYTNVNIFEVNTVSKPLGKFLAIFLLCLAVAVVVVYLLKALDNKTVFCKNAWIISIVHTAVLIVFLVYMCAEVSLDGVGYREKINYYYHYYFNWMFYPIIALNAISLVIAILIKFAKPSMLSVVTKNSRAENYVRPAENLAAYKELLDSGVITQEEFDAKKKQVLGL